MEFVIKNDKLQKIIKMLQAIYMDKFGMHNFAFFGQLLYDARGRLVINFGSFSDEEMKQLADMISKRANRDFDKLQYDAMIKNNLLAEDGKIL